jgi:hypothetical protein
MPLRPPVQAAIGSAPARLEPGWPKSAGFAGLSAGGRAAPVPVGLWGATAVGALEATSISGAGPAPGALAHTQESEAGRRAACRRKPASAAAAGSAEGFRQAGPAARVRCPSSFLLAARSEAGKKSARSGDPSLCGRRMAAQRHSDGLVCLLGHSPSRLFLSPVRGWEEIGAQRRSQPLRPPDGGPKAF